MPGFTTHYILGMKAYNDMPQNNLKFIIAKYRWLYQLGLQGPDMFFYNLPVFAFRLSELLGVVEVILFPLLYYTIKPDYASKAIVGVIALVFLFIGVFYNQVIYI